MIRRMLFILGYIVATFLVQGSSHFVVFARHYATIAIFNPKPDFLLGCLSMLIQGIILSVVFENSRFDSGGWKGALVFSWLFGAFLASYIALAEAGKYVVRDISGWIIVEVSSALVQYTVIGLMLGLIYRERSRRDTRSVA